MSGKKQHYIPQSLLRGFQASLTKKNITQVFVFKSTQDPYKTSTEGVGAERYFYSELSKNGKETLDDQITEYEKYFTRILEKLRNSSHGETVDAALAAELVAHLTTRNVSIRNIFSFATQELLSGFNNCFSSEQMVRAYFRIDESKPSNVFIEKIEKTIEDFHSSYPIELPPSALRHFALVLVREKFTEIFPEISNKCSDFIQNFLEQSPAVIKSSHNQALEDCLKPDLRIQFLTQLNWIVLVDESCSLILPDCVALSVSGNSSRDYLPYLLGDNENIEQILLPLNSSHLLVGYPFCNKNVFLEDFNKFAAECSEDFFVSSKNTNEIAAYATYIGKKSKGKIISVTRNIVETLFTINNSKVDEKITKTIKEDLVISTETTILLSFVGCANQEAAEQVGSAISIIVSELAKIIPITGIESIIFANDYNAAVCNLDRDFGSIEPMLPIEDGDGLEIATTHSVIRKGKLKSCVFAHTCVIDALLSPEENEDAFKMVLQALCSMLAHAGFIELVDSKLPGALLTPQEDYWDALLLKPILGLCSSYFTARISSNIYPNIGENYHDFCLSALSRAKEKIPKARLDYRIHGNLGVFLEVAIQEIGGLLINLAKLIGHYDGLEETFIKDDLADEFERLELNAWVNLYQTDLRNHFDNYNERSSIEEFTFFNAHIERLLWLFSVFPWRSETGEVRVEIPISVDLEELLKSS